MSASTTPSRLHRWRSTLPSAFWCVFWLAAIDVGVTAALHPLRVRNPESGLVRYFDYGRSIEGKLDRSTALPHDAPAARILDAGWLDPSEWRGKADRPAPGADLLVAVYGQSFAANASTVAAAIDGHLTLRIVGGPAASLDHSYGAFLLDAPLHQASVVVVGILASTVSHIGAMSGLNGTFENPAPFTFPYFSVSAGQLVAEQPAIRTAADFRTAFVGRTPAWQRMKAQLATHDRGFDPVVFNNNQLDASNIVKLMRRGWIAHAPGYDAGVYSGGVGFNADAAPVSTMRAILLEMRRQTQAKGQRLIVLIEQDRGYGDSLYRALKSTLEEGQIEHVSSHTLFSSADPANFVSDGHYSDAANRQLAQALLTAIRRPLGKRAETGSTAIAPPGQSPTVPPPLTSSRGAADSSGRAEVSAPAGADLPGGAASR